MGMKSLTEQIGEECIHFNGVSNDRCKAGVEYSAVRTLPDEKPRGRGYMFPCFKSDGCATCDKAQFPTAAEVAARVAEIEESSAKQMAALSAVVEDAKAKGFKKGRGGGGLITCPVCGKADALSYSVAFLNGHIWGKCSTAECVAWMM